MITCRTILKRCHADCNDAMTSCMAMYCGLFVLLLYSKLQYILHMQFLSEQVLPHEQVAPVGAQSTPRVEMKSETIRMMQEKVIVAGSCHQVAKHVWHNTQALKRVPQGGGTPSIA